MRILLVNPGLLDDQGRHFLVSREIWFGLTLPHLAGLIPSRHQLKIVDDGVETIDFTADVDVVMLTAMHSRAERAYQIADEFRARGKRVVMGGLHVSQFPEEALQHVDAVAVGEAEGLIEELIGDLESGRLKPSYRAEGFPELKNLPPPRYDLVKRKNYLFPGYPIQVNRGCPYNCRFCSVPKMMGRKYRRRPHADVLRDLALAGKFVFFVDDNFFADRDYALELFRAMKKMGKVFFAQGNLNLAFDRELLTAAREAGFTSVYVGIETLNRAALHSVSKQVNLDLDPGEAIKKFHAQRLVVCASMMLGFDTDTEESAGEMVRFLEQHKVGMLFLYILTPFPGTDLWREMEQTGRLRPGPWRKLDGLHANFQPKNMTPEQLEALFWRTQVSFYSTRSILKRISFPPRLSVVAFNFINQRKIPHRLHPWMGMPKGLGLAPLNPIIKMSWQRPGSSPAAEPRKWQ